MDAKINGNPLATAPHADTNLHDDSLKPTLRVDANLRCHNALDKGIWDYVRLRLESRGWVKYESRGWEHTTARRAQPQQRGALQGKRHNSIDVHSGQFQISNNTDMLPTSGPIQPSALGPMCPSPAGSTPTTTPTTTHNEQHSWIKTKHANEHHSRTKQSTPIPTCTPKPSNQHSA